MLKVTGEKVRYVWAIPIAELEEIQDELRRLVHKPSLLQTETQAELHMINRKLTIILGKLYAAREPSPSEIEELNATEQVDTIYVGEQHD